MSVTLPPAGRLLGLAETLETHRGFAEVAASLRAGHGGTIGGTWGSSSALAAAALSRMLEQGNPEQGNPEQGNPEQGNPEQGSTGLLVVVLPHAADAESFAEDLSLFTTTDATLLPPL